MSRPYEPGTRTPARSLGAIVGSFKAAVTKELRRLEVWNDDPLWQRNFYERIIRDNDELARVREYIVNNPAAWQHDADNPLRIVNNRHDRSWSWLESL